MSTRRTTSSSRVLASWPQTGRRRAPRRAMAERVAAGPGRKPKPMAAGATESHSAARDEAGILFDLLLQALKELGEAGQADRANRLAARAYVSLRKEAPDQAQMINVLMHRLA